MRALTNLISNSDSHSSFAHRFRKRRHEIFISFLSSPKGTDSLSILDVGGTEKFWHAMGHADIHDITLLNLAHVPVTDRSFTSVVGDARDLSRFDDKSFDVVFSNSVIEHVGTFDDQRQMASELYRVGKRFFLQTPNKAFPIEPHFLFPFFQHLPLSARAWLVRHFNLGNYRTIARRQR